MENRGLWKVERPPGSRGGNTPRLSSPCLTTRPALRTLRCIFTDTVACKPLSDPVIIILTSQMRKLTSRRLHILSKITKGKERSQNQSVGLLIPGTRVYFLAYPNVFYLTLTQWETSEDFRVVKSGLADDIIKPNMLVTFSPLKVLKE